MQDALLRVAQLVARGAASEEVFATIAREVGAVVAMPMVAIWRYDADGTMTVIGESSDRPHPFQVGTNWPIDGPTITARVRASGRPERIDDFAGLPGTIAGAAQATGIRACAGAPIVVDGRVWGAMSADTFAPEPLAAGLEDRLAEFTVLVATAISNSLSRERLVQLADQQAALRRVAMLVARQSSPSEVLHAVTVEVAELLATDGVAILQFTADDTATLVGQSDTPWDPVPLGTRFGLDGESVVAAVRDTGRTARLDAPSDASGTIAEASRSLGIRSHVATPILVEGRLWGTMVAVSAQVEPLPPTTEGRLGEFTELLATAISNAQARTELAASRARLVAAADEERRRVVRDLHDGAQQRLVQTVMTLKLAQRSFDRDDSETADLLALAVGQAEQATAELRELARGILPTTLTHGGLRAGVEMLADRMPLPVDLDLPADRFAPAIEATAYFVVAEALTNVVKHARARRASVHAGVEGAALIVHVRDDGVGGARPDGGGLVGLGDRVAALEGRLEVSSPSGGGTLVAASIPLTA
jgi:signal transduction histidine kinase